MKQLSFLCILLFSGSICDAQTFDEWFRQKATQKKYLIQQIAALQVYLGYVQKGYAIAQKDLTAISNGKQGDFNLHRDFFHSLKDVNPQISNNAKVAAIVAIQLKIVQVYAAVRKQVRQQNLFRGTEADYIFKVFEKVLDDCGGIIMDLTAVITSINLEMKDDERIKRIDAMYTDMQDAYVFAQGFGSEIKLMVLQRQKELSDVHTSRILNDLKNE